VIRAVIAAAVLLAPRLAGADAPTPTPDDCVLELAPGERAAIRDRLRGQRVSLSYDGGAIAISDIAGEGQPWVGVVERRGDSLWLVSASGARRLTGPLARPRIAGPGYTVWVIGAVRGDTLAIRRIGVLRPPGVRDPRAAGAPRSARRG
jgi:hypothetical protein